MNGWCQDRLYDVDGSLSGKHYYSFSLLTLVMKSVMTLVISSAATPWYIMANQLISVAISLFRSSKLRNCDSFVLNIVKCWLKLGCYLAQKLTHERAIRGHDDWRNVRGARTILMGEISLKLEGKSRMTYLPKHLHLLQLLLVVLLLWLCHLCNVCLSVDCSAFICGDLLILFIDVHTLLGSTRVRVDLECSAR